MALKQQCFEEKSGVFDVILDISEGVESPVLGFPVVQPQASNTAEFTGVVGDESQIVH